MSILSALGNTSGSYGKGSSKQESISKLGLMPQTSLDQWLTNIYKGQMAGGTPADVGKSRQLETQQRNQEAAVAAAKRNLDRVTKAGNKAGIRLWTNALKRRQDRLAITKDKAEIYKPAFVEDAETRQKETDQARQAITQYLADNANLVPDVMREQAEVQSDTLDELIRQGTSREGYLPGFENLLQNLTTGGTNISFGGQPVISNYMSGGKANALQSLLAEHQAMPGILRSLAQERSDINVSPEKAKFEYGAKPLMSRLGFAESPTATSLYGTLNDLYSKLNLPNTLRYLTGGMENTQKGEQDSLDFSFGKAGM